MSAFMVALEVPPQTGYFSVSPNGDSTSVTVGVMDKSRSWVWVRRGLPLTTETWASAELMYDELCARGWGLCWSGTRWF